MKIPSISYYRCNWTGWRPAGAAAAQLAYILKQRGHQLHKQILSRALWQWKMFQDIEYWQENDIPGWKSLDTNWVSLGLKSQIGLYLYLATNEERFKEFAVDQADKLLSTQKTTFYADSSEAVTGNFIKNFSYHQTIWQASRALAALADLCKHFPNHEDFIRWYFALKINGEFYVKPSSRLQEPYGLGILDMDGDSLIGKTRWISEGGPNTEANLNQAYGRLRLARVLSDPEIEYVAVKQLGWGMGENPFAICALYQVGEDYIEDPDGRWWDRIEVCGKVRSTN